MFARPLQVACAALIAAAPLTAQDDEYRWSDDRPDAMAPSSLVGTRMMPSGSVQLTYLFSNSSYSGVRLGSAAVDAGEVLSYYDSSPFQRRDRIHRAVLAFGAGESFTLLVDAHFADRSRDITDEDFFITTEASGVGDVGVEALVSVYEGAATRVHLSAGAEVSVGSTDERGDLLTLRDQILPYEMQPGSGSVSVVPGIYAETQNEFGTVGAQVKARLRLTDNDRDYRLGDEVEANGWIGYRLNDWFALTSGVRALTWGSIQGAPSDVDVGRDPGEDPVFTGGMRVDIPLGLNIYMPSGSLAGHRLSMEFAWPVHQEYDNFRVAADWGFSIGWTKAF